jgi:hypothetical protein
VNVTSTFLEFSISLIFFYLLLSALCSALQELLSNAFRWRSQQLEKALGKLLRDASSTGKIFGHPLLEGLKSPRWLIWGEHNPSYIPTESFARALLDLHATKGALPDATTEVVETLIRGAADFDKQRAAVEKWFDDSMDRVSGWYKRKAHAWLWVIATALCFLVNADSLRLAKVFWDDEPMRQSLVTAATTYVKENSQTSQPSGEQAFDNVKKAAKKLEETTIPLGWCHGKCWPLGGSEAPDQDPRHWPDPWGDRLLKLLFSLPGILITALAVSQGSPFWFDLLQKAVNLRLTGAKPEESKK